MLVQRLDTSLWFYTRLFTPLKGFRLWESEIVWIPAIYIGYEISDADTIFKF